jgi:Ser/Thr protein kinase RdoA (MazF antagonist)
MGALTGRAHEVHGMGLEAVEPDWQPLTADEVHLVMEQAGVPSSEVSITWHSPRPFSAAALVQIAADRTIAVKRHHVSVRDVGALTSEHGFILWLGAQGEPVPEPLAEPVAVDDFAYELLGEVPGEDRYRDAWSWTPYRSSADAGAAGRALASLHLAAEGYDAAGRPAAPLLASQEVITAKEPLAEIARLASERPALGGYLAGRGWHEEIGGALSPLHERALPYLADLEPSWAHNDWHGSNLFWSTAGAGAPHVTGVIDFGLCNRTSALYDLATAIERSCVEWLQPGDTRPVHLDQAHALLEGYRSVRSLSARATEALRHVLPIVHVEYALSEIEYFHGVVGSAANADLAYHDFLIGHLRWFASPQGTDFLAALC